MKRPAWLGAATAVVTMLVASTGAAASGAGLNEAGKAAYAQGDYEAAERLFGEAVGREPGEALFHYHRAVALTRLGRLREAASSYEWALRLNPSADLRDAAQAALRSLATLMKQVPARRDDDQARSIPPPSRRSFGPSSRDEGVAVPVRRAGGVWLTEVIVNDSRTARFLVDTGASLCVISPQLAAALSIEPGTDARTIRLQTLSGVTSGVLVSIASLRVGEAEAERVAAVVHDTGPSMDGILGNTFLGRYAVTLDAERGLLWLRSR